MSLKSAKFEDILDIVGEFGRFQVMAILILALGDFTNGAIMLYFVYSNAELSWYCAEFANNITLNASDAYGICSFNGSSCQKFIFQEDFHSIVMEWNLVCDREYIPQLITSLQMFGVLIGTLITGILADAFGRKKMYLLMIIAMHVFKFLVGLSPNWVFFAVFRFFTCIFLGGSMTIVFTLPLEYIGPKYRTLCGTFGTFSLSLLYLNLFGFMSKNWRHLAYIVGFGTSWLCILVIFFLPESVRWLIQRNRLQEAEVIVRKIASINRKPVPDMELLQLIAETEQNANINNKKYHYIDLFKSISMAKKTFAQMFSWFTFSTVAYGITTLLTSFAGSIYINVLLNCAFTLPFIWCIIYVANRFGRRKSIFGFMLLPTVGLVIVLVLGFTGLQKSAGLLINVIVQICSGSCVAAWLTISIYSAELHPTLMRNVGVAACSTSARIGGIVAPQITYVATAIHPMFPFIVYLTLVIISTILIALCLPETAKRPLMDKVHMVEVNEKDIPKE